MSTSAALLLLAIMTPNDMREDPLSNLFDCYVWVCFRIQLDGQKSMSTSTSTTALDLLTTVTPNDRKEGSFSLFNRHVVMMMSEIGALRFDSVCESENEAKQSCYTRPQENVF